MVIVVEPVVKRTGEGVAGRQVGHGNMPLPQVGDALICRKRIFITQRRIIPEGVTIVVDSS